MWRSNRVVHLKPVVTWSGLCDKKVLEPVPPFSNYLNFLFYRISEDSSSGKGCSLRWSVRIQYDDDWWMDGLSFLKQGVSRDNRWISQLCIQRSEYSTALNRAACWIGRSYIEDVIWRKSNPRSVLDAGSIWPLWSCYLRAVWKLLLRPEAWRWEETPRILMKTWVRWLVRRFWKAGWYWNFWFRRK